MPSKLVCLATLSFAVFGSPAFADAVKVVAAENFYGDMAAQIGGGHVAVTSILTNPMSIRICSKRAAKPPGSSPTRRW